MDSCIQILLSNYIKYSVNETFAYNNLLYSRLTEVKHWRIKIFNYKIKFSSSLTSMVHVLLQETPTSFFLIFSLTQLLTYFVEVEYFPSIRLHHDWHYAFFLWISHIFIKMKSWIYSFGFSTKTVEIRARL